MVDEEYQFYEILFVHLWIKIIPVIMHTIYDYVYQYLLQNVSFYAG